MFAACTSIVVDTQEQPEGTTPTLHCETKRSHKNGNEAVFLVRFFPLALRTPHPQIFTAHTGSRTPFHIRTMDWDMPQLKRLTIQVDFVRCDAQHPILGTQSHTTPAPQLFSLAVPGKAKRSSKQPHGRGT